MQSLNEPPHGLTLDASHLALHSAPLLDTVNWLLQVAHEQRSSLSKLSVELESLQAAAKTNTGWGAGIVSEIAADYTKDVMEKVQSRAASEAGVDEASKVPKGGGAPLQDAPAPPPQTADEPAAVTSTAADLRALISEELIRLEAELKVQLTQICQETCKAAVAEVVAQKAAEAVAGQEAGEVSCPEKAATVEAPTAETPAAETPAEEASLAEAPKAEAPKASERPAEELALPWQQLQDQVAALEAAVAQLRCPAVAAEVSALEGQATGEPPAPPLAASGPGPELEARLCSMEAKVQGFAAALEALSETVALEAPPPGSVEPGAEAPPRPPSRSAEIFGRLDFMEARVSALEQSKESRSKPEPAEAAIQQPMLLAEAAVRDLVVEGQPEAANAMDEGCEQAPEQAPEPNMAEATQPSLEEQVMASGAFGAWSGDADMDDKLTYLNDQVQTMAPEQAELLSGIVKDVKYCLKRCELLFQLPEIKAFIKRFQASLHVNAVLQDRWLGPAARTRGVFDDEDFEGNPKARAQTNSTMDLSLSNLSTDPITRVRRNEPPNKRPFRTVTDWARPHTPLTVDPVLKSSTPTLPDILPSSNK